MLKVIGNEAGSFPDSFRKYDETANERESTRMREIADGKMEGTFVPKVRATSPQMNSLFLVWLLLSPSLPSFPPVHKAGQSAA